MSAESNAQMHKQWCHDHKTWISDNWKCVCVMWSVELPFTLFPTSGRIYVQRTPQKKLTIRNAWFQQ
jgi:hypothetical protein